MVAHWWGLISDWQCIRWALQVRWTSVVKHLLMMRWVLGSILHGEPIELFLVPASAPWRYTKGGSMYYPVCGMLHIKEPLLLIGKSRPWSGGSGFPPKLSEWSFTIRLMPYNPLNKICWVHHQIKHFLHPVRWTLGTHWLWLLFSNYTTRHVQ